MDLLGTTMAVVVEDCEFVTTKAGNVIDSRGTSSYVFRFNDLSSDGQCPSIQNHSGCPGGVRGSYTWEIYGNTLSATAEASGAFCRAFHLRSGTGPVFNNNLVGGHWDVTGIVVDDQRSCEDINCMTIWDHCNGNSRWDGNEEANGYPCIDQIGRGRDTIPFEYACTGGPSECHTAQLPVS